MAAGAARAAPVAKSERTVNAGELVVGNRHTLSTEVSGQLSSTATTTLPHVVLGCGEKRRNAKSVICEMMRGHTHENGGQHENKCGKLLKLKKLSGAAYSYRHCPTWKGAFHQDRRWSPEHTKWHTI